MQIEYNMFSMESASEWMLNHSLPNKKLRGQRGTYYLEENKQQ